jgi:hypothetical protein
LFVTIKEVLEMEHRAVSLGEIESRGRNAVRGHRVPTDVLPSWMFFVGGFFGPPFFAVASMFVPLLGLLMSILSLILTGAAFLKIRAISPIIIYILGAFSAIALCFFVDMLLGPDRRESVLYFIVGGSMFAVVVYVMVAACTLWHLNSLSEDAVLSGGA